MTPLAKLGIVAGRGGLPARLAESCRSLSREYFVLAIEGQADPTLIEREPKSWIRLGEGGRGIDILHEQGVREIVFAGAVHRPAMKDLRPDARTLKFFARLGRSWIGDDSLLSALAKELESEGFRIVAPESLLEDVLAADRVYGRNSPDDTARADIARGFAVLTALADEDVGQAVIVQQGIVLGIEAAEGTDELIRRCKPLHKDGPGGVLVKGHKRGQERRIDLPAIGADTMSAAIEGGLRGIAVEAGHALVFERDAAVRAADGAGLFLIGLPRTGDG